MALYVEVTERQKHHLESLLRIKKKNSSSVEGLQEEIERAVSVMDAQDIAWVEKIVGVKAID